MTTREAEAATNSAPPSDDVEPDRARAAGRGGLAVLGAKVFFIATGFVQQALLQRVIGLADYGALSGRVLPVSSVFNNVVVASSTQGVSRTVASAGAAEREAFRFTLRVHAVLALLGGALLAAAAPVVSYFQHAPDVLVPLVAMAGVLAIYGVYAPLVGYLNGRGAFTKQAALDVVAATLRTAALLGLGWLFSRKATSLAAGFGTSAGVLGAAVGAVLAAAAVCLLALRWTGLGSPMPSPRPARIPDVRGYIALILPVMVAQLFTNSLMQADIILLGRYLSLSAPASQLGAAIAPAKVANEWVGVYRACQLFAFLPYQMLFSVTQVLFPMLARAKAEEGDARVEELVRRGCRIGVILCGLLVVVVLALPGSLIKFAYTEEVAVRGASTLRVLTLGQAAFAILGLSTTVLVSLGRERRALAITFVALVLLVVACVIGIPLASFGGPQLIATATATTTALGLALVVGAVSVKRIARAFVPLKTALRVGACVAGAFALGSVTPLFPKLLTPVVAGGVACVYLAALFALGELGKDDLALIRSIAARRTKR